jgi:hypothetical protein
MFRSLGLMNSFEPDDITRQQVVYFYQDNGLYRIGSGESYNKHHYICEFDFKP